MSLWQRLRGTVANDRLGGELDEELRSHVEMRMEENIAAGMSPGEAKRDAQRRFGNTSLTKEDTREMDIIGWLDATKQNLRYGWRVLLRSKIFAIVAVLTLALGIGANVAIFSVVHAVVLQQLPYPQPEQLVRVFDDLRSSKSLDVGMSVPELFDLRDRSGVFQDLSLVWPVDANLTGTEQPERVQLLGTSPSYFTILGVKPQLGRVYTVEDTQPGFTEGVVLSNGFWRRKFGADPNILGKKIRVDGDLYIVIGVMPREFRHPGRTQSGDVDVWAAAGLIADPFPHPIQRSLRYLPGGIGRLKPGLTLAQAQAKLDAYTTQLTREYPVEYPAQASWGVRLATVQEDLVGKVRTELLVLLGAVGFVLLITCVNLANLMLARAAGRQREIALRLALGAGKKRLMWQLLTESVLLATIAGSVAILVVVVFKKSLLSLAPHDLPRITEIGISWQVLLFAFAVSLLTGILFGLAPALQTVRASQSASLREGSRGSGTSKQQMRTSRVLVASEIALSLVLLIGAGLMLRSFQSLLAVHAGFQPHRVNTAKIWLSVPNDPKANIYATVEKRSAFLKEVLRRVDSLPEVEGAALGSPNALPMEADLQGQNRRAFRIENQVVDSERTPVTELIQVSPGYFDALKIPVLRGRVFNDFDDSKGQPVVVINETLERKYWPAGDALGKRVGIVPPPPPPQNPWASVVGVVGDVKSEGFDTDSVPQMYVAESQAPGYAAVIFLNTAADPVHVGELVREQVQSINPDIPVFGFRSMEEVMSRSLAERRFTLELLGVFAGIAALLAAIGIYGVMAYTLSQRTNEIGIRMAMGAKQTDILRMALGEGAVLIVIGVISGLAGAAILTRYLSSMLYAVHAVDPATFAGVALFLTIVALLACLIPAVRATKIEPLQALRYE
jgi:predicted permease